MELAALVGRHGREGVGQAGIADASSGALGRGKKGVGRGFFL